MISRYAVLANRIRHELMLLETIVTRCEHAMERSTQNPDDRDLYLAAAALHLHDFYSGTERVLETIANTLDGAIPEGRAWHRDLLTQMTLDLPDIRPPVLTAETAQALDEYLRFRHVVRNVYAFHLENEKVAPLVMHLRATFQPLRVELETFTRFLQHISRADESE